MPIAFIAECANSELKLVGFLTLRFLIISCLINVANLHRRPMHMFASLGAPHSSLECSPMYMFGILDVPWPPCIEHRCPCLHHSVHHPPTSHAARWSCSGHLMRHGHRASKTDAHAYITWCASRLQPMPVTLEASAFRSFGYNFGETGPPCGTVGGN